MTSLCVMILAGLSLVHSFPSDSEKPYRGHQVFDITTEHENHKDIVSQLVDEHELDVWRYPKSLGGSMSVRVRPEYVARVLDSLNKHGLHYRIKIRDVQDLVDEELQSITERHRSKRATSFDRYNYNSHAKINEFMASLAAQCSACRIENIGKSLHGRDMDVLVISNGPNKPAIFIDGGIHAREWISPATVINLFYTIATDPSVSYMIDWFDWYFLPVANPDGYEHSRLSGSRMWRKTRSYYNGCYGADPNRNFDYYWGHTGASSNPCSDTFRGASAFSEVETANMRNFINQHKDTIKSYITFHSYGQYFIYPWGHQGCVTGSPTDDAQLRALANAASDAIRSAAGGLKSRYTVGPSGCVLYPAAGGSDDWAKGVAGIKWSYTVELPDTGRYGFILPASWIEPVAVEIIAGMKKFASDLHSQI
ncbi:carboxypeptidase B-like [Liolophura sinensis]|uniref:carboxypeptidase B-like n=1 Tax=Liolophura sinensis TaxID=3198878 RepID=UPI0031589806